MASAAVTLRPAGVRAVGWGWRHAGRRMAALSSLDLAIDPGERVLLLGASGAGKSTLLAGLAGVLGGDEDGVAAGTLLIDGTPAERARGRVGLVLQDPDASVILSAVGDDVAFGCENLGVPRDEIWPRVRAALDAVGLHVPLDHPTARLSGGQKQRLALAGALAMAPGLLLLDEPTANLDPDGVEEVRDAVERAVERTGATLVVVEHRVAVWRPLVDRVVVLSAAGGVMADGTPDAVLTARGTELAAAGVWVPGHPPTVPALASRVAGEPLMRGEQLSIGRRASEVVRDQLDFTVSASRMLAVTGPNGSGKSTLALTVGGLTKPLAGSLAATRSLENGAGSSPARWKSRELLTRIGSVFQNPEHQFLAATVHDELAIGPRALGVESTEIQRRVDEVLERLGLARLARANPFTLSGGEKRRLSVGTAIATRPRLLVLDEPTFGQDSLTWSEIVALLSGLLDDGAGVMAITHDREFVAALGGDILSLDRAQAEVAG